MTTEIKRGSDEDHKAYQWAALHQGFAGSWQEWVAMPMSERKEYEHGAAGSGDPRNVTP